MSKPPLLPPGPSNPYQFDQRCPNCGRPVGASGYCAGCGSSRIAKITLWLIIGAPVIAFGACLAALFATPNMGEGLFPVILVLMIGGPVVGVLYLIVALIVHAQRRK